MTALAPTNAITEVLSDEPLLTENARKVLEARYLKKNEAGEITEPPSALFRRVAHTMAEAEALYGASETERRHWEDRFYTLMTSGAFMPNSPTLMNAGRELGMLSACFVLPVRDSINDIFDAIKHTAMIQKAGGGTGFAFDELRPTGDYIQSSGGTTSGPISFWRAFSEATNAIQQGAFRRGANMGMMYIHHPDILKFLHAKQDLTQFTNYNISVKITDAWMDEFQADADLPHIVRNPRNGRSFILPRHLDIWKYDIRTLIEVTDYVSVVVPESRECYYTSPRLVKLGDFRARFNSADFYTRRDIWKIIVTNAHATGEPGVVFIDRINEQNPTPHIGRMESTNPCGEQPLLPYEACNLGSINLGVFITNPLTESASVDWETLRDAVHLSVRFLDNVIDANNYVLDQIDAICKGNRKIGLGIMGFADALYKLGVAYNSDDGVLWGERFMKFVNDESHKCSEHLARCRGCFPNWKGSTWQTRHNRMMRNACSTTVAPTGTISIIANCSGGIEPMFSLAFIRNVLRGQKQGEKPLVEVNDTFLEVAHKRGFHSDELLERIAREGTLAHIDEVPDDIKRVFVCAHDITPEWHMKMQAAFQRHCDSSISKTINFPHVATMGEVEEIYRLAFQMRCKGVTVYRDGCRDFQPMALKKEESATAVIAEPAAQPKEAEAPAMPLAAQAETPAAPLAVAAEVITRAEPQPLAAPIVVTPTPSLPITLSEVQAVLAQHSTRTQPAPAPAAPRKTGNGNGSHAPREAAADSPKPSPVAPARTPKAAEPAPAATSGATGGSPASATAPAARPAMRPLEPQDLPEIVSGLRIRQATPFGNMHVKITVDPRADRELEVFAQLGKGGDVATSDLEAICRMISLWLRAGGSLNLVIKQLEGIGSSLQIPTKSGRIMSLGDGLACALKKYTTAKSRFGLRPLLLGEIDPADMDNPLPPPHHAYPNGGSPASEPRAAASSSEPRAGASGQPEPRAEASGPSSGATGGSPASAPAGELPLVRESLLASRPRESLPANPQRTPRPALSAPRSPAPVAPAAFQMDATGNFLARPAATAALLPDALVRESLLAPAAPLADAAPADSITALLLSEPAEALDLRLGARLAEAEAADVAVADAPSLNPAANALLRPAPKLDARLLSAPQSEPRPQGSGPADAHAESSPAIPDPDLEASVIALLDEASDEDSDQALAERYARLTALAEVMAEDDPTASTDTAQAIRASLNGDTFVLRSGHDSALHYKICCPQCDGHLTMQEGCRKCMNCGWAAC